ncbi:hypothetical protein, partial [Salmonella enterica]|uniref:hypothetical protein n=1 Tax=Salmonella enterica TaxID=28901 RepID=UPI003075D43E
LNGRAQFVSGTMAPAPASGRDLESLDKAIAVFAEGDVEKVIAQPKYMGSRCQAYLNMENPEQSFFVSRNGLEIRPT